jgi:putative tryptophan/tyrosine transport system substrate-binding protein
MHFHQWKRRRFITLLGGAAVWPIVAGAQEHPVLGFLNSASPGPAASFVRAFRQSLAKQGHLEGANLRIEWRWAEGHYDRLPKMASDLVSRNVSVIVATGGVVTAKAAKAVTPRIPILFIVGFDPVYEGLVTTIARPGTNATGVTVYSAELGKKRLELLREIIPANRIGFLVNPGSISTQLEITDLQENAGSPDLQLVVLEARTDADLDRAFEEAIKRGARALMVSADPFFTSRRDQIVALAARYKLPACYPWPEYAVAGGLLSYGTTLIWAYDQIGLYASRVLKGAKPNDLPVQLPTTFEMIINLRTAHALGITIPPFVLARADRVIE